MDSELSRLLSRDADRIFRDAGLDRPEMEEPEHPYMAALAHIQATYKDCVSELEKRHASELARVAADLEAVREANRKAERLAEESRAALARNLVEEKARIGRLEQEVRDERAMREAAQHRLEGEIAASLLRLAGLAITGMRAGISIISNIAGQNKVCANFVFDAGAAVGTEPVLEHCGGGAWFNTTAQINNTEMRTAGGANTLTAGTGYAILGMDL